MHGAMCQAAERSLAKTAAARTGPKTRQCDEDLMRELPNEISSPSVANEPSRDRETNNKYQYDKRSFFYYIILFLYMYNK